MKTIRANSTVSETSRDQEVPQNPLKRFGWKGAKWIAAAISVWLIVAGSHSRATDFDAYGPDKSGKTDVSSLLQKAVADAMASDKLLQIAPGKYWVASPVLLDRCNGLTIASLNPYSAKSVVLQGVSAKAEEREKKEKAKPVDSSRTPDKEEKKPSNPVEAQKESKSSKRTPIFEFNSNDSQSLVYVAKGAKLHAHDNAVGIWQSKKGQVFVKQEAEEDKSVRIGENIVWDLSAP